MNEKNPIPFTFTDNHHKTQPWVAGKVGFRMETRHVSATAAKPVIFFPINHIFSPPPPPSHLRI